MRKKPTILRRAAEIQRVENGPQGDASWKPYYKSLVRRRRGLDDEALDLEFRG
jgi:hypothetical protein